MKIKMLFTKKKNIIIASIICVFLLLAILSIPKNSIIRSYAKRFLDGLGIYNSEVFKIDYREIRNEKTIVTLSIYDHTDSINIKIFLRNDLLSEFKTHFQEGIGIKVKGLLEYDRYSEEIDISRIYGIMKFTLTTEGRMDNAIEKRVELHCHTKFSEMDAVSSATDIYKQAKKWGHKALAITDHGVVQAFTEKVLMDGGYDDPDFKIILGTEAYIFCAVS